jgi:serine/threonine protein kinase
MAEELKKFGEYYLIKKIATGGMAEVHLARTRTARGPEKYVAIKIVHPRYQEEENFHRMIVDEAKIAIQLTHKNICQVFDLGQQDGRYYIVMEYIDGYDLSRLQETCQALNLRVPFDVAAFIGREVCVGLTYAHARNDRSGKPLNLIHRDISPQNLLISFDGNCKIIDFGIAKVSTKIQQTHAGVIKGKFYYMSPEQAGADKVDQRSDLFSLGICLWETLCGRSLFRREGGPSNPLAILHEIRSMSIPRIRDIRPDCPPALDNIITQALQRKLKSRFSDAQQMQAAFNRYLLEHAPSFTRKRLASFVVRAFGKEEMSKEVDRVTTSMVNLMTRAEFQPDAASIIYDLAESSGQLDKSFTFVTDPSSLKAIPEDAPIHAPESAVTDLGVMAIQHEIAQEHTAVFASASLSAPADPPAQPASTVDPNNQTHIIPSDLIEAASRAADSANAVTTGKLRKIKLEVPSKEPAAPQSTPLQPLTQHHLFRPLVIGILVLCVLSATLAYLLIRRAKVRHDAEQQRLREENGISALFAPHSALTPPRTGNDFTGWELFGDDFDGVVFGHFKRHVANDDLHTALGLIDFDNLTHTPVKEATRYPRVIHERQGTIGVDPIHRTRRTFVLILPVTLGTTTAV